MFLSLRNLFNGKALAEDIVTTGVWFKNITSDVNVKTNGPKENKFRSFSNAVDL